MDHLGRREFFQAAAALSAFSGKRLLAAEAAPAPALAKYPVKFAVIGLSHDHIYGMTDAVIRGGGELVAVHGAEAERVAAFLKRYPQARLAKSEDAILDDKKIQLVLSAGIPDQRAPLGVKVLRRGKDYLSDKPGITSLAQLAEVRQAIDETGRIFAIMYSERLEVRAAVHAGALIKSGAIGKVIQTINIAPHRIHPPERPDWFWDKARYGGILCDIGSHQVDQFLYYTGSTKAEIAAAQTGNLHHPEHPQFEDFGDLTLRGDQGLGYVRVDWFTPQGLGVWGDGRLFVLGTDGYIELRKYVDPAGRPNGNHLLLVDQKEARYINCDQIELPFGPQFTADITNRTHIAQDQEQCLLAAELVLSAQAKAHRLELQI